MQRNANLLARSIFNYPRQFPVSAEAEKEIPRGSINTRETILIITTSAARSFTLIYPVKMAKISKAHHSKHTISIPGSPIFKQFNNCYFLKIELSKKNIISLNSFSLSSLIQQSLIIIFNMNVKFVEIAAPISFNFNYLIKISHHKI